MTKEKNRTITKNIIANHIHANLGIPLNLAENIISQLFIEMSDIISKDHMLKIQKFGNFVLHHKHQRPGRNMQTGERILIQARDVVRFIPSKTLKNKVNSANKEILHN